MTVWIKVDEGHYIDFSKVVAVRVDHDVSSPTGYGVAKVTSSSGELVDVAITQAHPYKESVELVEKAMTKFQERLKGGTQVIAVKRQ